MEGILAFCRRNPIRKLSLFGSVLRDDFSATSDVDFLVELEPNSGVGLFKFMNMQFELEDMIGRKVDLRTIENFPDRLQKLVTESAETVYVRER
jgi:predicted nucleotidyltransferase